MPISATFTSCCGLGTPQARKSRRPYPKAVAINNNDYYTVMSPLPQRHHAASFASSAAAVSGSPNGNNNQDDNDISLVVLDPSSSHCPCHNYQHYINHSSSSFGSSSLASFVSASLASPARTGQNRLVLLPVASSSPSSRHKVVEQTTTPKTTTGSTVTNRDNSLMTTLMMHVYEASPYKKATPSELLSASQLESTQDKRRLVAGQRLAQSSLDLNRVMTTPIANPLMMSQQHQQRLEEPADPKTKSKPASIWTSWSKRLVQALHGGSAKNGETSDSGKKQRKPKHYFGTASKATGSCAVEQQPAQDVGIYLMDVNCNQQQGKTRQPLRQAVSVSNCRLGCVMDPIPEHYEQRFIANDHVLDSNLKHLAFTPLSPESHILPQSPYHKADPNQMRSFFKSKSTAAFRELPRQTHPGSPSSPSDDSSMSPMRHDALAFLTPANQQFTSPSQPALIMRDWSSCALAAAAAAKRRPIGTAVHVVNGCQPGLMEQPNCNPFMSGTSTLPANFHMVNQQQPTASLIALIRAYNVPNPANIASRFVQLANIASVEQLAELALFEQNQIPRIIRRISPNGQEQQRLFDMIYDLVNITGGAHRLQQTQQQKPQPLESLRNVTNSSTDSGVYGSDGDTPMSSGDEPDPNQVLALRDFLSRAQIDLASLPYSDKFGFGHIQPDWVIGLAEVVRCDPISSAGALDTLRRDTLRKCGKIYIPQKDLPEKVRGLLTNRFPVIDSRSMQRPPVNHNHHRQAHFAPQAMDSNGCASLNRHFKQHTVSQPLLPSVQAAVSSRNVMEILCDCRSPDCVRL